MAGPRYTEDVADGGGFGNTLQPTQHPEHDSMPQRPPSAVGRPGSARRPGTAAPVGNVQMVRLPVGASTIGRVPRLQLPPLGGLGNDDDRTTYQPGAGGQRGARPTVVPPSFTPRPGSARTAAAAPTRGGDSGSSSGAAATTPRRHGVGRRARRDPDEVKGARPGSAKGRPSSAKGRPSSARRG